MNVTRESRSEGETKRFTVELAREVLGSTVVQLEGGLGTGKTTFARGFARELGITEPVTSPTFTILQGYEGGRLSFWHSDLYRLGDENEVDEFDYEDRFHGDGVGLVEWTSRMPNFLPRDVAKVGITRVPERGDDVRVICASGFPAKEDRYEDSGN